MQQDHRLAVARADIHVANIQVAGADLLDLVERPRVFSGANGGGPQGG